MTAERYAGEQTAAAVIGDAVDIALGGANVTADVHRDSAGSRLVIRAGGRQEWRPEYGDGWRWIPATEYMITERVAWWHAPNAADVRPLEVSRYRYDPDGVDFVDHVAHVDTLEQAAAVIVADYRGRDGAR